jgi:hypothetical protein
MTEEQMKQYVVKGGRLFIIKTIDTIRDGGTILVDTTGGKFYIHSDSKKIHSNYPLNNENLVSDILLIEYLKERIETYIKRCEEDVERNKHLLKQL